MKTHSKMRNITKTRKYTKKQTKHQTKQQSRKLHKFPWLVDEYNLNLTRIHELVERKIPQLKIYTKPPINEYPFYKSRFYKFDKTGKYYLIVSSWDSNLELNNLTDYFTEKCRFTCKFGKSPSALEYWKKNQTTIIQQLEKQKLPITNYNVREALYSMNRMIYCNNFRIAVCLEVLDIFKPKRWLDMSAGWGDRLISAILSPHVEEYCGVDPNPCLHPGYQAMIKHLDPTSGKKYTLIKDGFETAKLPNTKFDLVFSSPPFFDLEIYTTQINDSATKFNNVDAWFNGFLMPSIKKSLQHLESGGHLVLYIAEAHNTSKYIQRMINETDKLATNAGRFYYTDGKRIREFYCWRK
jgi:hypothetical protein